jgi:hypothetical protein
LELKVNMANKYSINIREIYKTKINIVIAKKKIKLLVIKEIEIEIIIGIDALYIFWAKIDSKP